jgi:DNA polymerase-3 subunit epsilon
MRFAVVDVETSGLDVQRHHILQVAVVLIDADGTVLDTYSSLVRPRYGMYSRVGPRHIHGISRWSLRRAPRPEQVLPHITRLIEGAVVTGHNVAFDVAFLERAAQRAGVPLAIERTLCTLGLSRWLDPDRQRRHRLTDLCDRYGITHARPHDALADALATAQVLPRLLAHVAADAPAALAGLLPPGDTLQP